MLSFRHKCALHAEFTCKILIIFFILEILEIFGMLFLELNKNVFLFLVNVHVNREEDQSMAYVYNHNVRELLDTTRYVASHLIFFPRNTNEVLIFILYFIFKS
jgi:hypothetical protein